MSESVLFMFSSRSFMVSGLTLRSLIHFELIFLYSVIKCPSFIFSQVVDQFSQHQQLKRLSSPLSILASFVKDQVSIDAWFYLWAFYFVLLIYISVSLCQYHTILMTVALQQSLKSGRLIPPVPFFFLKIALAIRGILYFHTNYEIICSSSVKNTVGSLIGIALNLQIALGSILIFTILILPIHEHGYFSIYQCPL